jgi:hypothetical protein
MNTAIVTLSRYPDILQGLVDSVAKYEPDAFKILITSGEVPYGVWKEVAPGWKIIKGIEPFIFARNANLGIRIAVDQNVLLINDDCQLTAPLLHACEKLLYENPDVGVLSPSIKGGVGNVLQKASYSSHVENVLTYSEQRLAFVCPFLPHTTIEQVGLLDESFTEYGGDDVDYCDRVRRAALRLAVAHWLVVKHGSGSHSYSASFHRSLSLAKQQQQILSMNILAAQKASQRQAHTPVTG